jgi:hypothetical protein
MVELPAGREDQATPALTRSEFTYSRTLSQKALWLLCSFSVDGDAQALN